MKKLMSILIAVVLIQPAFAQSAAELEAQGIDPVQPVKTKAEPAQKSGKAIPPGGLLMIPESGEDRVVAFDPQTGDLVEEYFIVDDPTKDFFSTPIQLIQSPDKTKLYVSDQLKDHIVEFDIDGNYVGVFAPAGGANPDTLNNVRGIEFLAGTNHVLASDGSHDAIIEFNGNGHMVGNFTTPGFVDPFDILYWETKDQYLVCDISQPQANDAVKIFDNTGNYVSDLITGISFPEQVAIAPGGNILVATFSSPSGIYEYTSDGTFVGYYDVVSSCRGVHELPNGNMLVTSGDGVYEVSKSNTIVSIKYQVGGANFRFISFVEPDDTTSVDVTFRVDMSQQTIAPEGVHIAGDFQGWDPGATAMTDSGNDIYTYTHSLAIGEEIEYKFINGDEWGEDETVPAECAQNNNRYITVPAIDTTLTAVCYGSCDPCGPQVEVTFRVDMSEQTVSGDGIHLAADFQGWDPAADEMTLTGDNIYELSFNLNVGEHYQYKFINGNTWDGEETVPAECGEDNGVGGYNRFIDVPDYDTILPAFCFSSCSPCDTTPDQYIVTFQIDMSEETIAAEGVHLAGSFQGWDPGTTPLTLVEDNIYATDVTLYEGYMYEYKFINGNTWDGAETVPEECGVDDGQGGYNRYIEVPGADTTLTALCFSSCDTCITIGIDERNVEVAANLCVYPNPFDNEFILVYTGNEAAEMEVELFNTLGKKMVSMEKKVVEYDSEWLIPSTEELPDGIYFISVKLTMNGKTESSVMKVIKR